VKALLFFLFGLSICIVVHSQSITATGSTTFCAGGNVILSVNPATGITGYQWIRDSIDIPSETSPTYVATISGSYIVRLKRGTLPDTTIGKILVTANPIPAVPSFTFATNNQCASLPFVFSISSPIAGITYTWDFGDVSSGTGTSVSHLYNAIGNGVSNYSVSVKATSAAGCISNLNTQVINVKQKPDPKLDGPNPTSYNGKNYFRSCSSDSSVKFDFGNASSTSSTNLNYKIIWGDGTADTAFSTFTGLVSHPFSIGTYPMLFIASGNNGCSDTAHYFNFVGSNPAVGLNNPGNTTICTGTSLTFPITGTSSNTPGTIYTVTFNDGTAPIVFNNIAPADVTHYFQNESCGTVTQTNPSYSNSFSATIQASNPCLTSAATVVPIYVSGKPTAAFTGDTVCVNSLATITNTSVNNSYVNPPNCTTGRFVWTITPASGWTIVSGNLGNDNGSPSPGSWASTATNIINLNFTQTGVYSVGLKVGNPVCGKDSVFKNICVNPVPVAAFNLDQNIGCAPLKVNTVNIPSVNNCGNNTYKWSVSYTKTLGCEPDIADFIYLQGTNANSINPVFQFNSPGVYTISLVAISPGGACTSSVVSKIVTVKSKPIASIIAPASVCVNDPVSPSATVSCYVTTASYTWSFPGGSPASSGNSVPGPVTYSSAGNDTISLDVANECGTTTITSPIAINTVTQADAGPSQNKCGSSITMAANTPIIGTGIWTKISGPNNPTIVSQSSPVTAITGMIPGTYIFKWTISNGNCTSNSNVNIIISPGASPAVAGSDQNLCLNTSTTLNAGVPATGTGIWTQVGGPNTAIIVAPADNATTVNGLIPGQYIFRWTVTFSNCTANTDDVQVTVYDNPSIANAGNDQTICADATSFAATAPAIGSGKWSQISGPNSAFIENIALPSSLVSGLIPGTYKFKWTVASGPCLTTQDTTGINVTAIATTARAGADIKACAVSAVTLAGNVPLVGIGLWTIVSGPAGAVLTDPSLFNTTVTGLVPGIYIFRWTITNGNCPPSADDVEVSIYANATGADAGVAQSKCGNSIVMAANTPVIGSGLWSLSSGPNSPSIVSPTLPNTVINGLIPGDYIFTWTITNGTCVSSSTVPITIFSGASPAIAGSPQDLCLATSTSLNAIAPATGTGQWTQISGPNSAAIADQLSNTTLVNGLIPGTYIFRWTVTFSNCPPNTDDVKVTVYDNPSNANAGSDQIICVTHASLMANTPAVGTGSWSLISGPNIPSITVPSSPVTTTKGMVTGTYLFKWTISNLPCPSTRDTVQITVTAISNNSLSGNQPICYNTPAANITGSLPAGGNGTYNYLWQQSGDGGNTWTTINNANGQDYNPGILTQSMCYRREVATAYCLDSSAAISSPICITVNPDTKALFTASDTVLCPLTGTGCGGNCI